MKFYLIAAVLGCALISFAACNVVAETERSLVRLEEAPQNVSQRVTIAAEPLNEASSQQPQKILSQMPELIHEAVDGQLKSDGTVENVNSSLDAVAISQEASVQNNREPKQLIGFIPTYMLHQAMRSAYNDHDDQNYDASDEIEEERAIRRRKRFRRRNTQGHIKQTKRHKNTNNSKQKKRRKVNSKRKSQSQRSSLRKKKTPRTKNRKTRSKTRPRDEN